MTNDRDPTINGEPRRNHTLRHILFAIPATICLTVVSTGLILFVSSI
ncbi:hypothetical protein [Sphingomonas crocodyli]|nr:hypothetical protein [Sphingomonas crocodyli]